MLSSTAIAPLDHRNRLAGVVDHRRRSAASDNLRGERLQTRAELRIGNLAQTFPELLRDRTKIWARRARRGSRRLALPENDPVYRGIAEEAVDPLDDQRGQVLDQGGMMGTNQQREVSPRFFSRR